MADGFGDENQHRSTFRWLEIIFACAIGSIAFGCCFYGMVWNARQAANRTTCQCRLKQLGVALHNYNAASNCFPSGVVYDPSETNAARGKIGGAYFKRTAFTALLPFMEETSVASVERPGPWYAQPATFLASVVTTFHCPASQVAADAVQIPYFAIAPNLPPAGQCPTLTDYILCKGVTDSWCVTPDNIAPLPTIAADDRGKIAGEERGMFDIAYPADFGPGASFVVNESMIADGLSYTFAIGEGAVGPDWPLTTAGVRDQRGETGIVVVAGGQQGELDTYQFWAVPPNTSDGTRRGVYLASIFGCTLEPLNKKPVTHTVIELGDDDRFNCRPSIDWDGDGPATGGGVHRTSNFRSDHRGGANFLYADGSVAFINEQIQPAVYRAASTIAGSEPKDGLGR